MNAEEKNISDDVIAQAAHLRGMADVIEYYGLSAANWRAALLGTRSQHNVEVPFEFLGVLKALGSVRLGAAELAAELRDRAQALEGSHIDQA